MRLVCSTDSLGGSSVEDCQLCSPGHYCQERGSAEPSGLCADGYYCPEGQISDRPQQYLCSEGQFCEKVSCPQHKPLRWRPSSVLNSRLVQYLPDLECCCLMVQGSVSQTACRPGSYQPSRGQGSCETCPAGFFCRDQGKA